MKGGLFTAAIVVFALWIAIAGDNQERIARTCKPVSWMGNISTSIIQLISPKYQDATEHLFNKFDYGCRFTIWRLIFEDDYIKTLEEEQGA